MNKEKKKILLIHRYFYPDSPPYAIMLKDIQELLIKNELIVDVLSSQPSYKSIDKNKKQKYLTRLNNNSIIIRLPNINIFNDKLNKISNFISFPILVSIYLLFCKKYDVISVGAVPPVLLAFSVALVTKIRGNKLVYHCGDIHPEIGKITGDFKSKYVFNLLRWMDNVTCKIASKIILLSEDMKKSIECRNNAFGEKIEIINNFDLNIDNYQLQDKLQVKKNRIIFTGNLGRAQNLELFILALKENKPLLNLELLFVGEGSALNNLKKLSIGIDQIKFIPHQSIKIVREIMSTACIGIVSLQKDIIKYAYPSKTMTYLSEGLPILLSVGSNSDLGSFIKNKKLGISLNTFESKQIYKIYKKINEGSLTFDRVHIKNTFEKNFSKREFSKKYKKLIFNLIND
jgi:glycosyltransferase involved in cell wall biosynthesis